MHIETRQLFDENASNEKLRMLDPSTSPIRNWKEAKYPWSYKHWEVMNANYWRSKGVMVSHDKTHYQKLSNSKKRVFKTFISFLNYLDGLQVDNLPHLYEYIGLWEIRDLLAIHNFQESIHAESYSKILMAIFETEPDIIDTIFDEWRNNPLLKKRNIMIAGIYQRFIDDKTIENFIRACMGNYNLESIFFWSGFTFFNLLAKQGEMLQTNQMIQYIKKDEQTHVVLFANILNELQKEYPEIFTKSFKEDLRKMMKDAVKWEIEWGCATMNDEIEGISNAVIEKYIKWLSNERLKRIGLEPLYPEISKHPMLWIEEFNDFNNIKEDIFENGALTNYQQPTDDQGWDELFE